MHKLNDQGIAKHPRPRNGLKVFGVGWHTAHQRALAYLPFIEEYDLVLEPYRNGWAKTQREVPPNVHMVDGFKPNYYDFAILHLDQQSLWDEEHPITQGDSPRKGKIFNELKAEIKDKEPDLPIVVINHMTPYHDTLSTAECVRRAKEKTKDCHMVVNSYLASKQWDGGTPIIHGIFPKEWGWDTEHFHKTGEYVDAIKEPRVSIMLSPAGMEKAYRRGFLKATLNILEDYGVPVTWIGVDTDFQTFDQYRDYLAKSLVFFFPAWQSPRPRSRTEAMLSGCCIVTTPYHGASDFITSGVLKQKVDGEIVTEETLRYDEDTNGFLTSLAPSNEPNTISNPKYTADLIKSLVFDNPDVALEIGKRGKKTATELFSHEKFSQQWIKFLKDKNIW